MFHYSVASYLRAFYILQSLLVALFIVASPVYAVPRPILPSISSLNRPGNASTSDALHAVTFAVPCPGCFQEGADAALPFELTHSYTIDCQSAVLRLNGHDIVLWFNDNIARHQLEVTAADRTVGLSIHGYCDQDIAGSTTSARQVLFFDVNPQDGTSAEDFPSFTALLGQSAQAPAVVIPHPTSVTQCLSSSDELAIAADFLSTKSDDDDDGDKGHDESPEDNDNVSKAADVQEESQEDSPIAELRRRFTKERQLIRRLTMDCHEERKQLFDELRECKHDFKCSSKALCEHVHVLFTNLMASLKNHLQISPMVSDERHWQAIVGDEKNPSYGTTTDPTSSSSSPSSAEQNKQSLIVVALEILAGVLGITGLCALIRRHCRSIRRRVDRLADREERKRAREYRRLARREAARKKWVTFKAFFRLPCRKGTCEEKRALVLEAAAPATVNDGRIGDVEQAWDAVLRARPDQLIAGVEEFARNYRVAIAGPSNSSRSGKHGDARSRSSSLPSYDSEKLPEYSSQPDDDILIVDGYRVYTPSLTDCSTNTGITPDSSIPDLSPRCSRETLRTLMSRD